MNKVEIWEQCSRPKKKKKENSELKMSLPFLRNGKKTPLVNIE